MGTPRMAAADAAGVVRAEDLRHTVLINATCVGRRLSGIGTYALSLVREFARIESRLRIVVVLNRCASEHLRGLSLPDTVTIQWAPAAISPDHGFPGHLLRLLYANLVLQRFRGSTVFTMSPLEAMFLRRDQVITVHDAIPLLFGQYHQKQYWYYRFMLGGILRRVRRVIVPSEYTRDIVLPRYRLDPARIAVIPNGVREIFRNSTPTSETREKIILFTGRSGPTKNARGVIEAFRMIEDRVGHNLVIVGSVSPKADAGAKGNGRIIFTGYVEDGVLRDLYSRADLFVFPTLSEGFGMPPLEAMACGCPAVVSRRASLPEVCGDAAHYVDPSDVRDIADGMYRVLTDDNLRKDLAAKGRERARRYVWAHTARDILAILDQAVVESSDGRAPAAGPT